ncbi:hypothetical protein DYB26_007845 [Aphanomyces astaci]|uniref:Uncharacterized protein n=1 Tax=Aphanomyces astaci TaxID=112090 RepID=A0A3R7C2N9_APHAT|nr:hypothetical protein DYB26_007845 [Aphanomyces astaci]
MKKATKEDKCKKMDKRDSDGHTVRAAAVTLGDEGDDNDSDEAKKTIMKKERRSCAIMKESDNAVMSFTSIMENTNKFKIDELAFQKESNAIAMRKLELDEKRYLLDKAEREARETRLVGLFVGRALGVVTTSSSLISGVMAIAYGTA